MTEPSTGPHRGLLVLIAGFVGIIAGYAFHELAGFRPFVPPILSGGVNMACADLDAYVQHVSDMSDHRIHNDTVGIHRQKTIDAVNELYDRARCQATKDAAGHMTYQKLPATVVEDVDDPGPHAAVEPPHAYPLYSHGVLVAPATAAPKPQAAAPRVVAITNRRHGIHIHLGGDDDVQSLVPPPPAQLHLSEENQAGSPDGAADPTGTPRWANSEPDPAHPPHCVVYKPGELNFGQPAGCR